MEIKNIVLHHIEKEINGKPTLKCSDKLITVNPTVIESIEKLIKIYGAGCLLINLFLFEVL
jgi:nucleoid-associated protein YejK